MKKLVLLAATLFMCLGLFAADINGTKDIIHPPVVSPAPFDLIATVMNVNNIALEWSNPVYNDVPMGFRVHCNGVIVLYVPGADISECVLQNACAGCHQIFVTAYYDSQQESSPSNTVEVTITANNENIQTAVVPVLKAYPNPFRASVTLSTAKYKSDLETYITIFNARGQKLKTIVTPGNGDYNWDARDDKGNRVPTGIYFAKAVSGSKSTLVKLMLTQ